MSMGGWASRIILRVVAALVSVVAAVWLALWYFIPSPPSSIVIAVGIKGGAFEHLAEQYRDRLARHHVKAILRITKNFADTIKLLSDPKSGVDAGFLVGGITNSAETPRLVSLGRITFSPVWIFYRNPEPLDGLKQLRGKRISVGPLARQIETEVLTAYGIDGSNSKIISVFSPLAIKALQEGQADAILIPQELNSPNIQMLLRDSDTRLMNVAQADALTELFPALNRLVLREGVVDLERNIPPKDVNLIALTNVVVAREDLHPELIYLLARTMKEEHGGAGVFHRAGEFPTQTDPEFPVAEEAVDFYKNGPSFLHRYLPFWMVSYAKRIAAIIFTAIAVIIPLFSYGPRVYVWLLQSYVERLYTRLRGVESRLNPNLTASEVAVLQSDLENISRSAQTLPIRHSSLFFDLIMHIRIMRTELASRAEALHKA